MAMILGHKEDGLIATARDLKGLKHMREELGFVVVVNNYRGFYYTIWRKYNKQTQEYDFKATPEMKPEVEKAMELAGWEKIKPVFTKEIPPQFRFIKK